MLNLILENKQGNTLELSQKNGFAIVDVQGLHPSDATINTSEMALIDGGKFNSSKVNMRTLDISFYIEFDAAKKRLELFKVVKTKQYIKVRYIGDYRDVYIEGYVETCPIDYFGQKQMVTVSILCPSPYFKEAQVMVNELTSILKMFRFPFAITEAEQIPVSSIDIISSVNVENKGDVETGLIIELYGRNTVVNPKIFDYLTGEFIGLNFTIETGDLVTIDTRKGEKSVKLLRNGENTNIFNTIMKGSKWLQLSSNGGVYTADVESGQNNLMVTIKHYDLFEGV